MQSGSKRNAPCETRFTEFSVESLESREMLAGTVTVTLRGNLLDLQGDDGDNRVAVQQIADQWHVTALDANTTIQGDTVVAAPRRLRFRAAGGNDRLELAQLDITGSVRLLGGPGNLESQLDMVQIGGPMFTRVTGGSDRITLDGGSTIEGSLIRITRGGDSVTEVTGASRVERVLRVVADRNAAVDVAISDGSQVGRLLGNQPTQLRNQVYSSPGGQRLLADVMIPRSSGPHPAVLLIHGGYWRFGNKSNMRTQANYLVDRGYTVVSINYRLAPQSIFPAQIYDAKAAVRWMRDNANRLRIDPDRIAAYGYSAGAHLALMLGVTDEAANLEGPAGTNFQTSSAVQAVIAGGAPTDFQDRASDSEELAYFLGGTPAEVPEAYINASPIHWVSPDDAPTLFYFGAFDTVVDQNNAQRMYRELQQQGVDTEFHRLSFATHVTAAADLRALSSVAAFLEHQLGELPA